MKTIGWIGTGNMGAALAAAAGKSGEEISCRYANRTAEKAAALAEAYGGAVVSNREAAGCEYVFLGVKPQQAHAVLEEILPSLGENTVLISMMTGWPIARIQGFVGARPVIRIMPNTPVSIGKGMILYACSPEVTPEQKETFLTLLEQSGRFAELKEDLIDPASAVTGCGPAFADIFVEALADGATACGIPKKQAIEMAAQMLAGSAELILESGRHPAELKDAVCSPGGTTIEGVAALENGGFRATVMQAVRAAYEKNRKM